MRRALILTLWHTCLGLDNGVGRTPAMGYSTWNDMGCDHVSAARFKDIARIMKEKGFLEAGYKYLNIDDCWAIGRDAQTKQLTADPVAFPDGVKAVADYVHALGFKFGIYADRGTGTCNERPGTQGYEWIDAATFAGWGVDYLKVDSCFTNDPCCDFSNSMECTQVYYATGSAAGTSLVFALGAMRCMRAGRMRRYSALSVTVLLSLLLCGLFGSGCYTYNARANHAFDQYREIRDALNATGRPVYYSLCGWAPHYAPVGAGLGNSWRINFDAMEYETIWGNAYTNAGLAEFAGPHAWNDPDMLIGSSGGGLFGVTEAQSRMQFSLWAVMAAPLLIGTNLNKLHAFDFETYLNKEVIAVNQDPLGRQGSPIWSTCKRYPEDCKWLQCPVQQCQEVWGRQLLGGAHAVVFVNWATKPAAASCDTGCFRAMGYRSGARVRDLWAHTDLGHLTDLSFALGANGSSRMFKLTPSDQTGQQAGTAL